MGTIISKHRIKEVVWSVERWLICLLAAISLSGKHSIENAGDDFLRQDGRDR
jgi:hypothetical protein